MSLINKMLKDLESRQGMGARADRPLFQDLHAVGAPTRRIGRRALLLGVVTLAALALFVWDQFKAPAPVALAPPPSMAQPTTPLTPVEPTPAPVTAKTIVKPTPPAPPPAKKEARKEKAEPKPPAEPKTVSGESGPSRIEKTERPYSTQEISARTLQDAERARAQGNPAEAERLLNTLLATQPGHIRARELLATLQMENGRWPGAQATLEKGMALNPEHLPYRMQLARLHLERGQLPAAITVLETARTADKADAELLAFLAALQQRANRHADAVQSYRQALTLKPAEGRWWIGLGISLESEKQTTEAAAAYRQALSGGPLPASLIRFAGDRLQALTPARP